MDGDSIEATTNDYYEMADHFKPDPPYTQKECEAQAKPRPTLLPMHALSEVVEVLTRNAAKHGDYTWRECDPVLYRDALGRHVMAYARGETKDEDGASHLAAIACNALILLEKELGL